MTETTASPQVTDAQLRRHVAQEIRVAMVRKGLAQSRLAAAIGMGTTTMSDKMTGKTAFSITDLDLIARHLDIDIVDLFPRPPRP